MSVLITRKVVSLLEWRSRKRHADRGCRQGYLRNPRGFQEGSGLHYTPKTKAGRMSGPLSDDQKWEAIVQHYEQAYKVRFASRPNAIVINYLYGEYLKFKETLRWLLKQTPDLEDKMEAKVGQKIIKSKKPKLKVLENLPKIHPSEFVEIKP